MTKTGDTSIYIASPYSNTDQAKAVRAQIDAADLLRSHGYVPIIPLMTHFWHMIYSHSYEFWMEYSLDCVRLCDAVLRLPGESEGADKEVALAESLGLPVYCSIWDLI